MKVPDAKLDEIDALLRDAQSDEWNTRGPALDRLMGHIRRDGYAMIRDLIADLRAERERWRKLREWLVDEGLLARRMTMDGDAVLLRHLRARMNELSAALAPEPPAGPTP